eukprot:1018306-Ditylum_brightwellii.AAC.1
MKVIGARCLVPQAGKTTFLSKVQFGNWKGRTALDVLLPKVTMMDSFCLFRLNRGLLNNDTVACYNCMILAFMSLHLQCLGLPDSAANCSVSINENMRHHVRTNAGESSESYQHSKDYFKGGEGQGKTSFPCNWLFTSSTLLKSLEEQC